MAIRTRLAEVAPAEDEPPDDVAAVMPHYVPHVDVDGRGRERVHVACEVVGLLGAVVVEPPVPGRAEDRKSVV